jgi:hypothetical protein
MTLVDWLLDSDPAIRWQVMRDLTAASAEDVARERARVATEGWGARLLALQAEDGRWGGGTYLPRGLSTSSSLSLLRLIGLDPTSDEARRAIALVKEKVTWEYDDRPFFEGEVEPCVNGMAVAIGAYFGEDVSGIVDRLLGDQMADGGWNCEQENGSVRGSFNSTIAVLEGLLEHEHATGGSAEVSAARRRGEEYLLERRLLRRLSTDEVIENEWTRLTQFPFPPYWHFDVLRGLDYLRNAGREPDPRMTEAIEAVESRREPDGRWVLDDPFEDHPLHFPIDEGAGKPSRWNTLRATRVLRWVGRTAATA